MKDFIKSRSWEDWLLYSIVALLAIGAIMFVFGFFFSFNYNDLLSSITGESSRTSISGLIGDDAKWTSIAGVSAGDAPGNLFTLMGAVPAGTAAFAYCLIAIIGVSMLFLVLLLFIIIMILGFVVDYVIPKIKAKKEA